MAKAKTKIITMSAHRYFNEPTKKFDFFDQWYRK